MLVCEKEIEIFINNFFRLLKKKKEYYNCNDFKSIIIKIFNDIFHNKNENLIRLSIPNQVFNLIKNYYDILLKNKKLDIIFKQKLISNSKLILLITEKFKSIKTNENYSWSKIAEKYIESYQDIKPNNEFADKHNISFIIFFKYILLNCNCYEESFIRCLGNNKHFFDEINNYYNFYGIYEIIKNPNKYFIKLTNNEIITIIINLKCKRKLSTSPNIIHMAITILGIYLCYISDNFCNFLQIFSNKNFDNNIKFLNENDFNEFKKKLNNISYDKHIIRSPIKILDKNYYNELMSLINLKLKDYKDYNDYKDYEDMKKFIINQIFKNIKLNINDSASNDDIINKYIIDITNIYYNKNNLPNHLKNNIIIILLIVERLKLLNISDDTLGQDYLDHYQENIDDNLKKENISCLIFFRYILLHYDYFQESINYCLSKNDNFLDKLKNYQFILGIYAIIKNPDKFFIKISINDIINIILNLKYNQSKNIPEIVYILMSLLGIYLVYISDDFNKYLKNKVIKLELLETNKLFLIEYCKKNKESYYKWYYNNDD